MKVGDFGLAVQLEHSCSRRNTTCGTSLYMAPELYEGGAVLKSDVWSLGISVIEMAEGKNPFGDCTSAQVMNRVMNKEPPSLTSSGWSVDLVDFVRKCLVRNVNRRASVEELLRVGVSSVSLVVAPIREGFCGEDCEGWQVVVASSVGRPNWERGEGGRKRKWRGVGERGGDDANRRGI